MNSFENYLSENLDLEKEDVAALLSQCSRREFAKDEFLLRQGGHSHYVYFVERGLLKQYSVDAKGKEHILMFAPENWFVADRESAYFNRPSLYFIRALEDSSVVLLEEEFINRLAEKSESFLTFNNRLLNNHIRHLQKRITSLLSDTAEERYLTFIRMYPDILSRVPQSMVASYLGIMPESLSRVRKELAERG